ncbi:unnamed protein product [Rotaria sp. Silwood2]|nr:unnamed protein product [Rotaria sp. Silwood2]
MSKKPKAILAIDSSAFETFVKLHLPTTVADVIILTLGIKTFAGFLQCNSLEEQLLSLYYDLSTDDKSYWYMHHTGVHTVKPNLLNEIKLFREACNSSSTQGDSEPSASELKRAKRKNNFDRRACTDRANNTNDDLKFKYRQKPTTNEDGDTDWSFKQEDIVDDTTFADKVFDNDFIIHETTHIYVTTQRIHHFFRKTMDIKAEEQAYQLIMTIRTTPVFFDNFKQQFENSKLQQDGNITGKVKWFISFIKTLNLRPSGYNDE